jgi:hypothetical protein
MTVLARVQPPGSAALWWDYGRLELYQMNNLHVAQEGPSPHALRTFLGLQAPGAPPSDKSGRRQGNRLVAGLAVHESAVLLNCRIGTGSVGQGCVLVNVVAPSVSLEHALLVNATSAAAVVGSRGGSTTWCTPTRTRPYRPMRCAPTSSWAVASWSSARR